MQFSTNSLQKLDQVRPDLKRLALRAIQTTTVDFGISEGLRDITRQKALFAKGLSKTMRSRHLTGHAIDVVALVGGKAVWDMPSYAKIAKAFKLASLELNIPIEWGGSWTSFKDGPHFQLPWDKYPIKA